MPAPSSLSGLKEIGCKSVCAVHIPPLFWAIEELLPFKIDEIWPRAAEFTLRFSKSDRLLDRLARARRLKLARLGQRMHLAARPAL